MPESDRDRASETYARPTKEEGDEQEGIFGSYLHVKKSWNTWDTVACQSISCKCYSIQNIKESYHICIVYGNPYLFAAQPNKLYDTEVCSPCHKHVLDTYNYYLQRHVLFHVPNASLMKPETPATCRASRSMKQSKRWKHMLDLLKTREMSKKAYVDPSYMSRKVEQFRYRGMPEYFLELLKQLEHEWIGIQIFSSQIWHDSAG